MYIKDIGVEGKGEDGDTVTVLDCTERNKGVSIIDSLAHPSEVRLSLEANGASNLASDPMVYRRGHAVRCSALTGTALSSSTFYCLVSVLSCMFFIANIG